MKWPLAHGIGAWRSHRRRPDPNQGTVGADRAESSFPPDCCEGAQNPSPSLGIRRTCPECGSVRTGGRDRLEPPDLAGWVPQRLCRACGHTWDDSTNSGPATTNPANTDPTTVG